MRIEIEHRSLGKILFEGEYENLKAAVVAAVGSGAYLRGVDLRGADLGGAYLRGADLGGAYLRGAYLGGAYLGGAYLRGAYLRGAYLRGAYLGGADLGSADLRGADLGGAYLRGAYLRGAYLGGVLQYSESHDIFMELVCKEKISTFSELEWGFIGQISAHRLCWDTINKRFGQGMLNVFKTLADRGFDEYFKKYEEILRKEKG